MKASAARFAVDIELHEAGVRMLRSAATPSAARQNNPTPCQTDKPKAPHRPADALSVRCYNSRQTAVKTDGASLD